MIPAALHFVSLKQRKTAPLAAFNALPLSCSKWLGAYSHRRQVHILTRFNSSRKNNSYAVWSSNLGSHRHKIFLNDRVERWSISMKVFRNTQTSHKLKREKDIYRSKLLKANGSLPCCSGRALSLITQVLRQSSTSTICEAIKLWLGKLKFWAGRTGQKC